MTEQVRFHTYQKHLTPNWEMLGFGPFKVLVYLPQRRSYGGYLLDVHLALRVAVAEKAALYMASPALFSKTDVAADFNDTIRLIRSPIVRILSGPPAMDRIMERIVRWHRKARRLLSIARTKFGGAPDVPSESLRRHPMTHGSRLASRMRVPVYLPSAHARTAEDWLRARGINADRPVAVVHIRSGEIDQKKYAEKPEIGRSKAFSRRNTTLESYFPLFDFLESEGFLVVRIGDADMPPLGRANVLDLPVMAPKFHLLETYFLMRSALFVGTASGPSVLAMIADIPMACVNAVHPVASYPFRRAEVCAMKHAIDTTTGRELSCEELLGPDYLGAFDQPSHLERYTFRENSPEEIVATVKELIHIKDTDTPLSESQEAWKRMVVAASKRFPEASLRVRFVGAQDGFIGEGRVAAWWLDGRLQGPDANKNNSGSRAHATE